MDENTKDVAAQGADSSQETTKESTQDTTTGPGTPGQVLGSESTETTAAPEPEKPAKAEKAPKKGKGATAAKAPVADGNGPGPESDTDKEKSKEQSGELAEEGEKMYQQMNEGEQLKFKKKLASEIVGAIRGSEGATTLRTPHLFAVHVINHPGVIFDQEAKKLTYEGVTVALQIDDSVEKYILE